MAELRARANGIELTYETFGAEDGVPVLLVMGLATQMVAWDEEFCSALAERGLFVIRYDNRDVGRSTWIEDGPPLDLTQVLSGVPFTAPYTLDDFAADATGLLDALELDSAHLVGASMGGMIAQTLVINHPQRVRSLTSIFSTTGAQDVGFPHPEGLEALFEAPPAGRDGFIDYAVRVWGAISSPDYPPDGDRVRARAAQVWERGINPPGTARQLAAIVASGDRTEALGDVRTPTLVIHGDADPLVDVSGGRATAAAIPDASLLVLSGMGHDLPPQLWPRLLEAIGTHIDAAERDRAGVT